MENYFYCNPDILIAFIKRLVSKTKENKICWHKNQQNNTYYISNIINPNISLAKFSIAFNTGTSAFDEETITLFVDGLHNHYTVKDEFIWKYLKELEWDVSNYEKSLNYVITSMFESLSQLDGYNKIIQ